MKDFDADILGVRSWPVGSIMCYNSTDTFFAIGLVISNDGINAIRVLWSEHCKARFVQYPIDSLNRSAISRLSVTKVSTLP